MKKYLIFLALLCLGLAACKKDDPCENITCLNGGTCANGSCNCPTGYTGSDCSQQATPKRINITSISVTAFPITDVNGSSWDFSNGADLYVELLLNETLIAQNEAQRLVNSTTVPVGWSSLPTTFEMTEVTNQYTLRLYDSDDLDAADFIGGIVFTPYSSTGGFPSKLTLSCSGCDVAFELGVDYDF